jgi:hypothetical protein
VRSLFWCPTSINGTVQSFARVGCRRGAPVLGERPLFGQYALLEPGNLWQVQFVQRDGIRPMESKGEGVQSGGNQDDLADAGRRGVQKVVVVEPVPDSGMKANAGPQEVIGPLAAARCSASKTSCAAARKGRRRRRRRAGQRRGSPGLGPRQRRVRSCPRSKTEPLMHESTVGLRLA